VSDTTTPLSARESAIADVAREVRRIVSERAAQYRALRDAEAKRLEGVDSMEWEGNLGGIIATEAQWAMWGEIPKAARGSRDRAWKQDPDLSAFSDEHVVQAAHAAHAEALERLTTKPRDTATPVGEAWRQAHHEAALSLYNDLRYTFGWKTATAPTTQES
jgi:hypothetical protein